MQKKLNFLIILSITIANLLLSTCTTERLDPISVVTVSDNNILEPFIEEFEKKYRTEVEMHYKETVEIMIGLQDGTLEYDAVWPADTLWIFLGDKKNQVKHIKSIMTSPVVFGIKKPLAERLGWTNSKVYIKDILEAIRGNQLNFIMASATQSNSGASAYMGFLYALADNPDVLTMDHLHSGDLKTDIRDLLSGIHRSSGSSEWLKQLFLESDYDAMVNYEALIIKANQELTSMGREPLYLVYPMDGIIMADSPLGYIDRKDEAKESTFLKFQKFLLSEEVQDRITQAGWRPEIGWITGNADPAVFNPDWGVDVDRILTPVKLPGADVIDESLFLYQTVFRKPSLTVFCLDYSESMSKSGGIEELKTTMRVLLNQESAGKYMVQSGEDDITIVFPFSLQIFDMWTVEGNNQAELDLLYKKITELQPAGETDIYTPVITALDILSTVDTLDQYMPAVILMTDGESNQGRTFAHLQKAWETYNIDIPVFPVLFDQADNNQLDQIGNLTRGKVFDGRDNLLETFITVKGYN